MRLTKFLLFLLLPLFAFAQPCKIKKTVDEFEGGEGYAAGKVRVSKYTDNPPAYGTFFVIGKVNGKPVLVIKDRTRKPQSNYVGGEVILILDNDEKMILDSAKGGVSDTEYDILSKSNMWVNLLSCNLTDDQLEILTKHKILKYRIKYDGHNKDGRTNKMGASTFMKYAKCIQDLE